MNLVINVKYFHLTILFNFIIYHYYFLIVLSNLNLLFLFHLII